jgi:catechol 2,3-dioxygenase-like lactoylglutathione lyase family enzyme
MTLRITRLILFARNVPALVRFYRDTLGLRLRTEEVGWAELDAGGCRLALHRGRSGKAAKIVFGSRSVDRDRAKLLGRGVRMGPVRISGRIRFSDGRDPEGNVFQLSNRP